MLKRLPLLLLLLPVIWIHAQSAMCDTSGVTTRETYPSPTLGQSMFYTVYTPPCYDTEADAYPVIYLMHGSNDDDNQWVRLGLTELLDERILSGEMPPIMLVMPFGNLIANRNQFDSFSWNHIFLNELMPDVESKYNMSQQRDNRAIGGISRGGFWAYQIAFANPDLFSAVGGHSAFFDLYHADASVNPLDLALTSPNIETMRLWLDRGIDDFADVGLDIMNDRLIQRGADFIYNIYPIGEHNNIYWSAHIEEYLDFYVADWLQTDSTVSTPASFFVTNTPNTPPAISTPESVQSISEILLPVVAFPSLQTSISLSELQAIADGSAVENLILTPSVAEQISANENIVQVNLDVLRTRLWQSRHLFTMLPLSEITLDYRILLVDEMPILEQSATYPFAGDSSQLTRFTLSGVTALTRNTRVALDENGIEWAVEAIQPYVTSSDFFHMSNEVSFVETCPQSNATLLGGSSSFCSNPSHFDLFNLLEVDVVELTGNHNNDYGYPAYEQTLEFYRNNQIEIVGGGQTIDDARMPYMMNHNGNTIALVACNASGPYYALASDDESALGGIRGGATNCDMAWLEATLPNLAQAVDVVIVSVQYVEVEDYLPLESQQFDFRRIANLGADVVIGSQAHKPQTFEFYPTRRGETAFIHYGLGNLFFDQPFWGNQRFFLDTLYIYDGQLRGIELFTGIIDDLARPRLMTADERQNFMYFMLVEQNGF